VKAVSLALTLSALTLSFPAFAGDASAVIRAVEGKYATVNAMTASFVQVTHSATFGDEQQSGNVSLKRPKMMLWDFAATGAGGAGKKQFVSDGKSMWVYTADAKQAIRYDQVGESSQADALLQSLDHLDEMFTVDLVDDKNDPGHVLALAPKKQNQIKQLRLELDPSLLMKRVVITDQYDNVTELQFSKVTLNPKISDSTFQFKPPAGVEVISAGGKGK